MRGLSGTHCRLIPVAAALALALLLGAAAPAPRTVRIGLPTKTYWPTVVSEAAVQQKLFEKEGLKPELTIYRGGAEAFEALAAGAADVILDTPAIAAAGQTKGIRSRLVAGGAMGAFGWQLMVPAASKLDVAGLAGKKVAITSTGSGSDLLALWTMQHDRIDFTRVPVGGGGLVPNLLVGNVDAAVVYSPLSFELLLKHEARTLVDYAGAVPPNLNAGWIATDKLISGDPDVVQRTLNALYGGLLFLRTNRAAAVKLIAGIDEVSEPVAEQEYDNTILKLETDGAMDAGSVTRSLDLARLGGMHDLAPAAQIMTLQFKPVPTTP